MKPIRIMIAGCGGGRGIWFTQDLAKNTRFELVALADTLPAAAHRVAAHIGQPGLPVFTTTAEALEHVQTDAVLIATPDGEHTDAVLEALAHGAFAYVEKPLAISIADCLKIVEADHAAGGRTMVGFNLRFAPVYATLHSLVRTGAVGDILTLQADEFYGGGKTYFRRWNRLRRFGGGLWITKASHDFDLLYWLAGSLPVRVGAAARLSHYRPRHDAGPRCETCPIEAGCPDSAQRHTDSLSPFWKDMIGIRKAHGWYPDLCLFNSDKDTFDHGTAQIEFANDALATYTLNVVASFTDRTLLVSGTQGALRGALSADTLQAWSRSTPEQSRTLPLPHTGSTDGHGGGDARLMDDFAAFIHGDPSRATPPLEASVAIAIGIAATRASDENRMVSLEEIDGWATLQDRLRRHAPGM